MGLNWQDYGARFYDAAIARFHTNDPKSELLYPMSTYTYAANNPILYIDKNGENPVKLLVKSVKGIYKYVSRNQAKKVLQNKGSVYTTGSSRQAKKLMKEANPNSKLARHDGHKLKNGKTGKKHWQKKAGDGSHVFYSAVIAGTTSGGDPAQGIMINVIGNGGKIIVGDNAVGNFLDDWLNPTSDLKDLYNYLLSLTDGSDDSSENDESSEEESTDSNEQETESESDSSDEQETSNDTDDDDDDSSGQ